MFFSNKWVEKKSLRNVSESITKRQGGKSKEKRWRKLEAQTKRSNISLIDVPERENKGRHTEGIIKEIIQENCRT